MSDAVAPPPPPAPSAAAERIPPPPASTRRRDARPRKPPQKPRRTEGSDGAAPSEPKSERKPETRHSSRQEPEPKPPPPQQQQQQQPHQEKQSREEGGAPKAKTQSQSGTGKPPKQFLPELPVPASFRDAEWFAASGGDLRFAHTLFGRAQGLADVGVVGDAAALARVYRLYVVGKKVLQELQGRSARPADDDEGGDEGTQSEVEGDDEAAAASPPAGDHWLVSSILAEARDVLVASRLALFELERQRGPSAKKPKRLLEHALVKELMENVTELLLSRAGYDDIPVLEAWLAFVSQNPADLKKQVDGAAGGAAEPPSGGVAGRENTVPPEDGANPSKRDRKRQQKQQRQVASSAEAVACDHIRVCVAFLRECHAAAIGGGVRTSTTLLTLQPPAFDAANKVESELKTLFTRQRINEADERERLSITQHLQQALRRGGDKWRDCQVVLFGSSLSLYGSVGSDLDLCLLRNPSQSASGDASKGDAATTPVGTKEIRAILNGRTGDESGAAELDMVAVQELNLLVMKSVQKIAVLYHDLTKGGPDACSHPQLKQLQQLQFIRAHYKLLQDAIQARVLAIEGEDDGQESARAVAAAAAARRKELVARSRRQSDDMFRVRAILERASCKVRMVIHSARVPIIRFQHMPTRLDCDMCFENVLATRNTFLLRAYAAFDNRARVLGVAVKHWAKKRAINDASMGFLSSYSFVLLTIYFLQAVAGVLPNLQDPELLASARVPPEVYNGVNIAFCTAQAAAQSFYEKKLREIADDLPARAQSYSVGTLLAWFFEFYATTFDFSRRVVSIRSPDACAEKLATWGVQKTRLWRISLQDPLETSRDLGSVLKFQGQEKILLELKRAHKMLKAGKRFAEVANPEVAPPKPEKTPESTVEKKPARAAAATIEKKLARATAATIEVNEPVDVRPRTGHRTNRSAASKSKPEAAAAGGDGARGGVEKPRQAPRNRRNDRGDSTRAAPAPLDAKPSARTVAAE